MKKIKILFLCMALALCTIGVVGCGNDNYNGSSQSGTSSGENSTSGNSATSSNTNDNNDKETSSDSNGGNNGIMDDIGDTVETLVDDAATAVDDVVK